jgi:hypothetical protein
MPPTHVCKPVLVDSGGGCEHAYKFSRPPQVFLHPAARSKWIFPEGREVVVREVGGRKGYLQVQFWVHAGLRANEKVSECFDGGQVEVWKDRGPGQQVEHVQLEMGLHQLVCFLSRGFTNMACMPVGQELVVIHQGECKGCCCAPWHLDLRDKSENDLRWRVASVYRGRRIQGSYANRPGQQHS